MKHKAFLSLFLILFLSEAHAEKLLLQDEKKTWSVAIADFEMPDTSPDTIYIRKSLPAFFFNQLSVCRNHTLSENERSLVIKRIVEEKISEEEKNLTSFSRDYNMTFFQDSTKKKELKDNIHKTEKKIRQIKKYNTGRITVKPVKDISFISSDEKNEALTFERVNIGKFVDDRKLDYLIYGSARQFSGVLLVEVKLYSALEKKVLYNYSLTTDTNSLYASMGDAVSDLISILLGAPWSRITVITENKEADIYLNGTYIGSSIVRNMIVPPGIHSLEIKGQGIERKVVNVYLEEKDDKTFEITARENEEKLIALNTLPQDADVYYDSLWRGKSPFLLNGLSGEIIIKKEGYRETRLFLDDVPGNYLEVKLSPDIFKKDEYFEKSRNTFYRNLSFFALSVPVPFFLFAVLNDYSDAYNNSVSSGTNSSETERLRKLTNFSYYGYYGSLFLSISLFVNTIFHLNDYIKAGDILAQEQ